VIQSTKKLSRHTGYSSRLPTKIADLARLCANDGEAPFDAPLHTGARRFYRERGFLK
jgi:TRAP-type uncharacterized transport system substrate-binding protein